MDNKSKSDRIHELLPRLLGSRQDPNWSALIGAIGAEDDRLAALIEQVRDQFFVKTASRPHLDRLAANSNISRPKFIGIGDAAFRNYVPILSYQPKQVKKIVEMLLDLFFFKEATTAFLSSGLYEPYTLKSDWDLTIRVDNSQLESIKFVAADFSDISSISTDELVAAYNRQAKYSYAMNFFDSVTKHNYVRVFTHTVGTQGSLEIVGGLANIGLQLNGFLSGLGTGSNTQWTVTKVGDSTTFTYTGGELPGLDRLEVGDIYLCDLPGNEGSFTVTSVEVQNSRFQFTNLFATTGVVTQTSSSQSKFLRPERITPYRNARRALTWETQVGKVTVEMPATPSIVQRGMRGGFHINGVSSEITLIEDESNLHVADPDLFPESGQFVIEPVNEIVSRLTGDSEDETATYSSTGRLISSLTRYSYELKTGTMLQGINPSLPLVATLNEQPIVSMYRTDDLVTCMLNNDFEVGEHIIIRDSSGIPILTTTGTTTVGSPILSAIGDISGVAPGQLVAGSSIPTNTRVLNILDGDTIIMTQSATATSTDPVTFSENTNGSFEITIATNSYVSFKHLGTDGVVSTPGTASVERLGLAEQGSRVILTSARAAEDTGIVGPYVWDAHAPFVLSSHTATTVNSITAGKTIKLLDISANTLPDEEGFVVFDYGQNNQEGPVRYLYKPIENILALDSSYTFQQNHSAGCSIVALSHKGAHIMSGLGNEYPPYLTNPSDARLILQELIKSVTSAGIFVDFLVRYPTQLYGTLSVYD